MSWWLDSEDEDGTRHYSVYNPFTGGGGWPPTKRSLTPAQRRRLNRAWGLVWLVTLGVGLAGWIVGRRIGDSGWSGALGVFVAIAAVWLIASFGFLFVAVAVSLVKTFRR